MVSKRKRATGILGGVAGFASKNPSFLALAALGIGLFIFRDRISNFVSGGLTGAAAGLGGAAEATGEFFGGATQATQEAFGATQEFFGGAGETLSEFFTPPEAPAFDPLGALGMGLGNIFSGIAEQFQNLLNLPAAPMAGAVTPALPSIPIEPAPVPMDVPIAVSPGIAEQVIAPFVGGGVSFIGGTIREIPVERLSLSDIIDRFGVSATQARDIQFRAQEIEPTGFIPEGFQLGDVGAVSDPQFTGLSAMEIAERLTGGLITRF